MYRNRLMECAENDLDFIVNWSLFEEHESLLGHDDETVP